MKTRLIATGVLLAMSTLALADRGPPSGHPLMDIDKLEVLLDLDSYQKSEVQRILDAQRDARRAKREQLRSSDTRPSFEQRAEERAAAQKATRDQLAQVLNAQQLKKFDVLAERPDRRRRVAQQER